MGLFLENKDILFVLGFKHQAHKGNFQKALVVKHIKPLAPITIYQ